MPEEGGMGGETSSVYYQELAGEIFFPEDCSAMLKYNSWESSCPLLEEIIEELFSHSCSTMLNIIHRVGWAPPCLKFYFH